MRRLVCRCGSERFKVHPKHGMIQCWACNQRYVYFSGGGWIEFNFKKEIRKTIDGVKEVFWKPIEWAQTKLQHPKREKNHLTRVIRMDGKPIEKPKEFPKQFKHPFTFMTPKEKIRSRWHWIILELHCSGKYCVEKNEHFGKLRGKNIAKVAHRDLGRIGIKTRLKFEKDRAILEAV